MKRVHALPTAERLNDLLRYDGKDFYWRSRPLTEFRTEGLGRMWNTRNAGAKVFLARRTGGYLVIRIGRTPILAHRAAWALYHGKWPTDCIDHINGDVTDNRIENLRDCSRSANMRNQKLSSRNTSGVPGVYWSAREKRWYATVHVNGRRVNLGAFRAKDDAIAARKAAERKYDYHENHGRLISLVKAA